MKTLVASPFKDDAEELLEWAYGSPAKYQMLLNMQANGQRRGQAFMNVLRQYDRDEHDRLTGSLADPFYNDKKIPAALDRLTSK